MPLIDPEFYSIPVRQDIEILPADKPKVELHDQVVITDADEAIKNGPMGFRVFETIGVGIINTRALAKLTVDKDK